MFGHIARSDDDPFDLRIVEAVPGPYMEGRHRSVSSSNLDLGVDRGALVGDELAVQLDRREQLSRDLLYAVAVVLGLGLVDV